MSQGKFGHLWFAAVATIVGGGGLLERGSFSSLSVILGMGLGIWLQWLVELVQRSRKRDEAASREGV
jgi:hypothetical protein